MIQGWEEFWGKLIAKAREVGTVYTLSQRQENKMLDVTNDGIIVCTDKSPEGRPVDKSMFEKIYKALSTGKAISHKGIKPFYRMRK